MKWLRKKRVLLLVLLGFIVLLFSNSGWLTLFYPIHYKDEIRHHAENNNLDPFMVAAIIRVETNYKPSKESKKGALGLMQIMPDTAEWVLEQAKLPNVSMDKVNHEPGTNIEIGTWYLNRLSEQFDGNMVAVIAAYNAGPTRVKNWLKTGVWDGSMESASHIPLGETRHYVQRVIHYYEQYTEIYKDF